MLKKCPCGETPTKLHLTDNGSKWAYISGDCCGEWMIEFRTNYALIDSPKCMDLAIEAWNKATRGK